MKKSILCVLVLAVCGTVASQTISYQSVVDDVLSHSPMYRLILSQSDAEVASVYSGSLVEDPSLSAAYYWGSPAEIGKRWDLSVTQSFEFPTVYKHKSQYRDFQSSSVEGVTYVRLKDLVARLQTICSDLVYQNALVVFFSACEERMEQMASMYGQRMRTGDCSILDYNRSQMELSSVSNRLNLAIADRDYLLDELQTFNGGMPVIFIQDTFDLSVSDPTGACGGYVVRRMGGNADSVRYPGRLALLRHEYLRDSMQVVLARDNWIPKFDVGYASENVVGETFRGVTFGLSLPFWNNRREVASARCRAQSSQLSLQAEIGNSLLQRVQLMKKADAQRRNIQLLRAHFAEFDSQELLRKALDAGEISLESYLQQVDFYSDAWLQLLEAQHLLDLTILQLESLDVVR